MSPWKHRLHEIIFEADTPAGRLFDVLLLWAIVLSVCSVMLESVASMRDNFGSELRALEWFFTGLFTLEYLARIASVQSPRRYIFSFFGLIDLLAIIPTYISLIIASSQYLLVIRSIRLLRVFRVLKLVRYLGAADGLAKALHASRPKITVFLGAVFTIVLIVGTLMFLVEGEQNGFTSIPKGVYWAVVTLTTVGYGDIVPQTPIGQFLSAIIMIMGYGVIAVPTGIVSVELSRIDKDHVTTQACPECCREGHMDDAIYCKFCGQRLNPE